MPPLGLHPDNPRYFRFRGRPAVLVTAAEHYGAVLNGDFDYARYLEALAADGLNHTRIFSGAYCEHAGAFQIARNTLAPASGRLLCPWARSQEPGYAGGGCRFDLGRWDEAYFARLRDFVKRAGDRDIVVEVNLFCPFYRDEMWDLSPMKGSNNVNGVGDVAREEVYTLDRHGGLLPVQEAMVRKVVAELRDFDNLYYEVMNEPYARDIPMAWQERIVEAIVDAEADGGDRHLISLNVANRKALVDRPHPAVSIFNFHYAWPPETVALNYGLQRPIGDNETGFKTTKDFPYRREGWAFLLSGGALFNHLDYSFAVGCEDGSYDYPETQPGGGSAALRRQLRILREFVEGFDFVRMAPAADAVAAGLPEGVAAFALAEAGRQYAVYLCHMGDGAPAAPVAAEPSLSLPAGGYCAEWIDTLTGEVTRGEVFDHAGGLRALQAPAFSQDAALRVVAARR